MRKLITATAALIFLSPAWSAEFCATSAEELHQHLETAETNNSPDTIKLVAGAFTPNTSTFRYQGEDDQDLTIIGGWTSFMGNPCGQRTDNSAFGTSLDGDDTRQIMLINMGDGGADIHIQGVTFANGYNDFSGGLGGGLRVRGNSGWSGNARIEQCAFLSNFAYRGSAVYLQGGYRTRILNSLFLLNTAQQSSVVYMTQSSEGGEGLQGSGQYFINNTVLNNDVLNQGSSARGGVRVWSGCLNCSAYVANNLMWDNEYEDIVIHGSDQEHFYNNNYANLGGIMPVNASNNTSIEPVFEPGILNFAPALDSVMVDAGRSEPFIIIFPPPFGSHWDYGDLDANGNGRMQNRRVDIGAFEAARESSLFVDGFGL